MDLNRSFLVICPGVRVPCFLVSLRSNLERLTDNSKIKSNYTLIHLSFQQCYGPVTLGRIDLTYKKRMLFVNGLFMSCYYPPNALLLGDVCCKKCSTSEKGPLVGSINVTTNFPEKMPPSSTYYMPIWSMDLHMDAEVNIKINFYPIQTSMKYVSQYIISLHL